MRKPSCIGLWVVISLIGPLFGSVSWAEMTGLIAATMQDPQSGEEGPAVNTMSEGMRSGTVANIDGNYSFISISPASVTLIFTCIGSQAETMKGECASAILQAG